eukprot:6247059-Lingulodinium_polyedra.AAC.1
MEAAQVSTMLRRSSRARSVMSSGRPTTRMISPRYWRERRRSAQQMLRVGNSYNGLATLSSRTCMVREKSAIARTLVTSIARNT